MSAKSLSSTRRLTLCAVMAAVMCVLAPISIPIGPISITGGTLAIYLTACLLGGRWGAAATLVYLLLGFVGLPVFSNYMGGAARLLGPTGGYLVGYLPMTLLAGAAILWSFRRFPGEDGKIRMAALSVQVLGLVLGTAVLYAFGTAWFMVVYPMNGESVGLWTALTWCVFPYVGFDALKIALALVLTAQLRRHVR